MRPPPALLALALAACAGATPPPGGAAPEGPAAPTPGAASPAPTVDPNLPPANPGPPTGPYEAGGVEGDLEVRQLGAWSQSPYQEAERAVIRDQGALERLWARLGVSEDMPKVDFGTDVVIVAALGQRPSGGYGISVRRAAIEAGKLMAEVVSVKPGSGCATTMALTQPVEVVAVAAAKVGEVGFVEKEETKEC